MRPLARALLAVVRRLIPAGRPRWVLAALVLLGALLPVTELLVARLFAEMITDPPTPVSAAVPGLLAFAGLFLATRGGHYLLRTRRIGYLRHALGRGPAGPPASESWRWALGLELLTVLTALAQVALVAAYVLHLAPPFGIVNLAALAVLAHGIGRLFAKQLAEQRSQVAPGAATGRDTHARLRSRVVSAERGALLAAVAALVLLVLVVVLSLAGRLSAATALVLFLAVRMQTTTLTTLSGSVMRLARAEARSQPVRRAATDSSADLV